MAKRAALTILAVFVIGLILFGSYKLERWVNWKLSYGQKVKDEISTLEAKITKLDRRVFYLEVGFNRHKKDCMLFSIAEHPKCSCGFEQALNEEP